MTPSVPFARKAENNHEADQETLRRIAEGSVKLVETGGDVHA